MGSPTNPDRARELEGALNSKEYKRLLQEVYEGCGISRIASSILESQAASDLGIGTERLATLILLKLKGHSNPRIADLTELSNKSADGCLTGIDFPKRVKDYSLAATTLSLESHLTENPKESVRVMMGTTPNGDLHLANIYTILNGAVRVNGVCRKLGINAQFILGFNDTFIAPKGGYREPDNDSYKIPREDMEKLPERLQIIQEFLSMIEKRYGVKIEVVRHSELQGTEAFREILLTIAEKGLFQDSRREGLTIQISPAGEYDFKTMKGEEANGFDFRDSNYDFSSDFRGMVALRANYFHPDIHALGDDLVHDYRIYSRTRNIHHPDRPFKFGAGVLYGPNGDEMHVSGRNIISFTRICDMPDLLEFIYQLGENPVKLINPLEYGRLLNYERNTKAQHS